MLLFKYCVCKRTQEHTYLHTLFFRYVMTILRILSIQIIPYYNVTVKYLKLIFDKLLFKKAHIHKTKISLNNLLVYNIFWTIQNKSLNFNIKSKNPKKYVYLFRWSKSTAFNISKDINILFRISLLRHQHFFWNFNVSSKCFRSNIYDWINNKYIFRNYLKSK